MGGFSQRVRWIRIATAGVTITMAIALMSWSTAGASMSSRAVTHRAAPASVPTLGLAGVVQNGMGFGQIRPQTVNNGGDPTSYVSHVKWTSWGGARALGHGRADWVWPGWCVACGSVGLSATVVAFDRTTCQGQTAYAYVEWYFPSRGMTFDPHLAGENLCGARPMPSRPEKEVKCGHVRLQSDGATPAIADAITMYGSPIACSTARRFVARSGASRYVNRNARFHTDGWWCGSELSMELGGPQSFSCVRGDFVNVAFDITPVTG